MLDKEPEMTREEAWAELVKRNVAKVVVEFSGGHDEGGTDCITLENAAGEKIGELEENPRGMRYNSATGKWEAAATLTPDEKLAEVLAVPVYQKYYSFAGEFNVAGTVTWDVAARTVKLDASESVDTYESIEEDC